MTVDLSTQFVTILRNNGSLQGARNKQKKDWVKSKPKMRTHCLQSEETVEQCWFNLFNVISQTWGEPIYTALKVNGNEVKMEMGRGASVSAISQDTFHKLWGSGDAPALQDGNIPLETYTGECIALVGATDVGTEKRGEKVTAILSVVEGEGPIFYRKFTWNGWKIWGDIKNITVAQDILAKYANAFRMRFSPSMTPKPNHDSSNHVQCHMPQ